MPDTCDFCHGKPVGNAATWLDGKPRPPMACPRCGEVTFPDGRVASFEEQLEVVSRAALTPAPDGAGGGHRVTLHRADGTPVDWRCALHDAVLATGADVSPRALADHFEEYVTDDAYIDHDAAESGS